MSPQLLDPVLLQTDYPGTGTARQRQGARRVPSRRDHLLFVATDRISAFDYVLATGIPHKGRVLTQISLFWFDFLKDIVPNHLVTADVNQYPAPLAEVCRPTARALHAGGARRHVPGGVRGARLHLRISLEGVQSDRQGLRHRVARRAERVRPAAGADLHAGHQGHHRARREHFVRGNGASWSVPN